MQLKQQSIIGTGAFDDVGRPVGVYWNADRTLLAVAGAFAGEQWHGRFFSRGRRVHRRVSLYEAATLRRIVALDWLRSPINDIAFHPHLPLLAIGAGRYDGDYFYEGELVLWDFQAGITASLLDESREVVACRFDAADEALHLTLRPPINEVFHDAERGVNLGPDEGRALRLGPRQSMFIDLRIPADGWRPLRENSITVDQLPQTFMRITAPATRYVGQEREQVQEALAEIAADAGQRYTARWDLWDLAWTPDDRILATRNATAVECWSASDEQSEALILAAHIHHPQVSRPVDEVVVRRRLPDGLALWTATFASQVTALLHVPERQAIVVALTNGTLAVLDALTGTILDLQPLIVASVASVALSLAGRGDHVAAGLMDGRIVLYSLE